jgi:hypothetical protein
MLCLYYAPATQLPQGQYTWYLSIFICHFILNSPSLVAHIYIVNHTFHLFIYFILFISREATHRLRTSNNAKSNPEIKGRNSIFFFRHDALQVSGHALFTSTSHVFLLNTCINKTERSIHFYWIHFLNKIVTWLTCEYVYLWYRLLEINVGTRDTAADEML